MHKKFRLLLSLLFLSTLPISAVNIVIHGTFSCGSDWYQPRGGFFETMKSSMYHHHDQIVAPDTHPCFSFIPYSWSGANNDDARITGARGLAEVILSYPITEPITIAAHSHGGNVTTLATQLLYDPFALNDRSPTTPDDEQEAAFENYIEKQAEEFVSDKRARAVEDEQEAPSAVAPSSYGVTAATALFLKDVAATKENLKEAYRAVRRIRQKKQTTEEQTSRNTKHDTSIASFNRKISRIFLLGTPIHTSSYNINMNVVDQCYSLYSLGDRIQRVLGIYHRKLPAHPNLLNIKVTVSDDDHIYRPGHSELHSEIIARWLLTLPHRINKELETDPDGFKHYEFISATFFSDGHEPILSGQPVYEPEDDEENDYNCNSHEPDFDTILSELNATLAQKKRRP
jgi:hypothetical protein